MHKFIYSLPLLLSLTVVQAGIPTQKTIYYGPTEMLIARESWDIIEPILLRKKEGRNIPKELIPFFNSIAAEEDWGHIGYHGANHGFRFYQDVIKFTFEEILNIPIRDDFQFLRWPGDSDLNLNSVVEFKQYWEKNGKVDNRDKVRSKQLLSMNYGIYSNFDLGGSCSISLFAHDKSAKDVDYAKALIPFYKMIGIKDGENKLNKLYAIFNAHLTEDSGILLQLSENSHLVHPKKEAYHFADKHCYPSIRGGSFYDNKLISVHYANVMVPEYVNKIVNISDQLRLVINNRHTLNPHSHLKVKRWDRQNPRQIAKYEKAMRNAIRVLTYSTKKWIKYQDYLLKTWKQAGKENAKFPRNFRKNQI